MSIVIYWHFRRECSMQDLVIATRASPLAMRQAVRVRGLIEARAPIRVQLLPLTTEGDERLDAPLRSVGGKGLFVKALEAALLDGRADLAVHSMKDMPAALPEGLAVTTVDERADARDALVGASPEFDALPAGARIGSSSLRRGAFLKLARPDLEVVAVRGNVATRLGKLDDGQADALVLACAGLIRLGLTGRIRQRLSPDLCLPAAGQGALAVEYPAQRADLKQLLGRLAHAATQRAVAAERALVHALGGDCNMPLGAFAAATATSIALQAALVSPCGERALRVAMRGAEPNALGKRAAEALFGLGAAELLAAASAA